MTKYQPCSNSVSFVSTRGNELYAVARNGSTRKFPGARPAGRLFSLCRVRRAAILVVYADTRWHELERAQLQDVYRNICVMLDEDLDEDQLIRELDEISTDVMQEIEDQQSDDKMEAYWQACLELVVSEDVQQLTVGVALAAFPRATLCFPQRQ